MKKFIDRIFFKMCKWNDYVGFIRLAELENNSPKEIKKLREEDEK